LGIISKYLAKIQNMEFINTILLLIAITGLGIYSRYKQLFTANDKIVFNSFIYRFALPALLINTISKIQFNDIEIDILIGSVVPILIAVILMISLYLLTFINKEQMVISSITLAFGSNAFFGIAYFDSLYGAKAMDFAVLSAGVLGIVGIVVSVAFLEYVKEGKIKPSALVNILKSPPVFAIIIGIILAVSGIDVTFFDKASQLLGKTAGGLAIFVLGMFMYDVYSLKLMKLVLPYVLLRALLLPLITYAVLILLPNVSEQMHTYLFQQSGIPGAIAIAVISQRYNYHHREFSAIVMLSSILSFVVLGLLYTVSH